MPFSVNDIRTSGGTGPVPFDLDKQIGTTQSVGRWLRFMDSFNTGDVRRQDADMLAAVRDAFRSGRDISEDVRAKATGLAAGARVDRATGSAQISGLAPASDKAAAALAERASLHLTAELPKLSADAKACGDALGVLVRVRVLGDPAAKTNPGSVDIAAWTREAIEACEAAIQAVRRDSGESEPELVALIGKNVDRYVLKPNGALRTKDEINCAVQNTCGFYRMASEDARRALVETSSVSLDDAAYTRVDAQEAIIDFLRDAGEPVDALLFGAIKEHVAKLPMHELLALGPNSSASEILGALRAFTRAADPSNMKLPPGVPTPESVVGQAALLRFICRWAALQMPAETRRALHDLLLSVSAGKALSLPAQMAAEKVPVAVKEDVAGNALRSFLHKLEGNPGGKPLPVARDADITDFSPADRCAYEPGKAFSGSARSQLRANILGGAGVPATGGDSAKQLHDRIDTGARSFLDGYFARSMKTLSEAIDTEFGGDAPTAGKDLDVRYERAFDKGFPYFEGNLATQPKDIETNAPLFRMPDGTMLPKNTIAARNVLARLATGKPDATYATLSPADRAKANVFIALLSCNPYRAADRGVKTGLSPNRDAEAFRLTGDTDVGRVFTISGSAKDGFVIRCGRDHRMTGVDCTEAGSGKAVSASGNGSAAFMLEIRLSPSDLESLAGRDWKSYDPKAFGEEAAKPGTTIDDLKKTVPEGFRFAGDVSASFSLDFDTAAPSAGSSVPTEGAPAASKAEQKPVEKPVGEKTVPQPSAESSSPVQASAKPAAQRVPPREMPTIRNNEEFAAFFKSLTAESRFGAVTEGPTATDAAKNTKRTFHYKGIVFRAAGRAPARIKNEGGFHSLKDLSKPENLTEAMGLGTRVVEKPDTSKPSTDKDAPAAAPKPEAEAEPKVTIGAWGATGRSGVSTAKSVDGALGYRGAGEWIYVIDTSKLPEGQHAWDMESTVYENGYKTRDGEDETGGEVNCSDIPLDAIVGWVQITFDAARIRADSAEGLANRLRALQTGGYFNAEFNPAYKAG